MRVDTNVVNPRVLLRLNAGVTPTKLCDGIGTGDRDQGVGSPDHFPEPTTSSTIHYAIHAFTHLLGLWGRRYEHIISPPNFLS